MGDPLATAAPELQLPKIFAKYQQPGMSALPPNVQNPLLQLDLDRARKGLSPLSNADTALAANAASTQQAITKQPGPGFFGRALNDVEGVLGSIPHLPGNLLKEFSALPQAPGQIAQGISDASLPEIFSSPGLRMVPGSYLLSHGPQAFVEHPVLAALDLAPAISHAAGLLPEAATEAIKAPINSALDKFGVGPMSQDTARLFAQGNRKLTGLFNEHAATVAKITEGLSDADVARLTEVAQRGNPAEISQLAPAEQNKISQIRNAADQLAQRGQDLGMLGQFDKEVYPIQDAQRLQSLRTRYYNAVAEGQDGRAQSILNQFSKANAETVPSRFRPLLDQQFQSKLGALAQSANPGLEAEAWGHVQKLIANRFYDMVPNIDPADIEGLAKEVTPMWQQLKESGADPVFIHGVTPEQVGRLRSPKIFAENESNPQSVKAKTWNMGPSVNNFSVGLNYQGMEYLHHEVTNGVIDALQSTYGKTRQDLINEYMPIAEKMVSGPDVPLAAKIQSLISKDYTVWDPSVIAPWKRADLGGGMVSGEPEYFMPKAVESTVRKMYPVDRSQFGKLWDSTMGVFRVGILPLSPRWHIYNGIGGMAMLMGHTGPAVLKYMGEAREMIKNDTMPLGLSRGMGSVPEDVRAWNYEAGNQIGKLLKDHWGTKVVDAIGGPGSKLVNKMYDFQSMVDNMYRTMGYLYGRDKAVTAGLSAAEAETAGVKLGNKVFQDWDAMTPVERQVIRSIFPFYGWAKHIISYVATYPWDHPYRAGIMANFARNEMQDWKSGVPQQFNNFLFAGKPDQYGNQTAVPTKAFNPFMDVANYFTLAGFIGQMNPVMTGLMTAMGLNPRTGSTDLYPNLTYNADTGKLEAAQKNPFLTIAEGLVPQAAGVQSLLGLDTPDLQALKLNNPAAYRSRILSSFGVPAGPRTINKGLEAARSELVRSKLLQTTLTQAIKSGDFTAASKYPQLQPIVQYLDKLEKSGALDSLKIQQAGSQKFDVNSVLPLIQGGSSGSQGN